VRHHAEEDDSDAELVRRFLEGDKAAFGELTRRHERRVYNLAYRMLGNPEEARDATQETFLSCFRNLRKFRGDAAFSTWLHRIAVNTCYDSLRKRGAASTFGVEPPRSLAAPDPVDQVVASVDVQQALLAVPPEFRAVLVLHEIQDLPVDRIAEAMQIPVGTVKSRLHRGRLALARALGGEPDTVPGTSKAAET
jgi:RNA polymerase sigma-70 factor, ECF subfamily